ncbi:MAG: hypothetical protein ACJ73N_16600 [Bryobacteraceae bacterium]
MKHSQDHSNTAENRRSFLKKGFATGSTATIGTAFLADHMSAFDREEQGGRLPRGDAAILRFLAAAEIMKATYGSNTTNSAGFRTAKCRAGAETRPIRKL